MGSKLSFLFIEAKIATFRNLGGKVHFSLFFIKVIFLF